MTITMERPATELVDGLTDEALALSVDWLRQRAKALDEDFHAARSVEAKQAVRRRQNDLMDQAGDFIERRIQLLTEKATISGEHIRSATAFVDDQIARIQRIKDRLKALGKVLDFFAVVATGDAKQIVLAAVKLRKALEDAG